MCVSYETWAVSIHLEKAPLRLLDANILFYLFGFLFLVALSRSPIISNRIIGPKKWKGFGRKRS
jgi:hypothetical protein